MSLSWQKRKSRLGTLLNSDGDEDAEGLALDRILHGQSVIGKTSKTNEVDSLRFSDNDLNVVGTLEFGQYGVIDLVTCKLDGAVYVRKSTEKRFALKTHDQCSPQYERDILLQARKTDSNWAPHLLCAFQTPTHLNLVMDYAEGGTLWDVLESSPHDGKILESDLKWWVPQVVSAIHWCHSQGFVHRDVKPHNFVLTPNSHVLLIDFGSAAPLLPAEPDGSQRVPNQHCLVPCGTCDYISPEILRAHEEALVALEMADDDAQPSLKVDGLGYGRETDWWSMGAMIYEMAYGIAPFFANDIRRTYLKITEHYNSLKFDKSTPVSSHLQDFLRRLLTSADLRLGRGSVEDIKAHVFFACTDWSRLHDRPKPPDLHLPQFTYSTPVVPYAVPQPSSYSTQDSSESRAFAFSALLFQSSPVSNQGASIQLATPSHAANRSILREQSATTFIGFSWGPPKDAFLQSNKKSSPTQSNTLATPDPLRLFSLPATPFLGVTPNPLHGTPNANTQRYPFATPVRPNMMTPYQTLPRASTIRRTAPRRTVSDREAMKQLVDCVGMSARKRVLESERKRCGVLSVATGSRSSTLKGLRFDSSVAVVSATGNVSYKAESAGGTSTMQSADDTFGTFILSASASGASASASVSAGLLPQTQEQLMPDASSSEIDSDIPPSPSPGPRPGSAMSIMSRRSQTPTATSFNLLRVGQASMRSEENRTSLLLVGPPSRRGSISEVQNNPPSRRNSVGNEATPVVVGSNKVGRKEEPATRPQEPRKAPPPPLIAVTRTQDSPARGDENHSHATDFSYDTLDEYDQRYARLMHDIASVEQHLGRLSTATSNRHRLDTTLM